jgi:23S rRNA (adenine2503-C2)-methyltransferase
MSFSMEPVNLKALDRAGLAAFVAEIGERPYRARQIYRWIYAHGAADFAAMTDLSAPTRRTLEERAALPSIRPVRDTASTDGTRKFLFRLEDGETIESVWIPEPRRVTLCVSTQAGCALNCSFCLTGRGGLRRNLAAWEIVDQYLMARRLTAGTAGDGPPVTNLVMMGMGEPLANLDAVVGAIEHLVDREGIQLAPRRVTISTAGIVPRMAELGRRAPYVNLAVSLAATTDALRDELIPINRKWPLETLLAACRDYPLAPRQRILFEYMLIRGLNDTPADARRLIRMVHGIRCKVNLMSYNPIPGVPYERPEDEAVHAFRKRLETSGVRTFVRRSRGRDILAACGQLRAADADGALAAAGA